MRTLQLGLSLVLTLGGTALAGCGDDAPPGDTGTGDTGTGDTGMGDTSMPDTGVMDTAMPGDGVCTAPIAVVGEIGTVTVSGNTATTMLLPTDLGPDCGDTEATSPAPQEVIAYQVPGTEVVGVRFTLATAGTSGDFVAVVQVRSDCEMIPEADACFDPTAEALQPSGAFSAMGGDTLYILVTGFAGIEPPRLNAAAWEMEITAAVNDPSVLVGGQLSRVGDALEVALEGTDDVGVKGYRLELQTADGMGIDLNEDGMVDADDWFVAEFDEDLSMSTTFVGTDRLMAVIADMFDANMAVQADVAIRDIFDVESPTMTLMITDGLGVGATCDMSTFCAMELTCTTMACAASAEATTACESPTLLTIPTPTDMTTSTRITGSVPAGTGALTPSCTLAVGPEVAYALTVPGGGTFDVVARTDLPGTGDTDTMLYLRSSCADPTTEVACNDDIDLEAMVYTSNMELLDAPAGDYVLIVEQWAPNPTADAGPFALEVAFRPVLATAATCDNAGILNRCAAGPCAGGVCP